MVFFQTCNRTHSVPAWTWTFRTYRLGSFLLKWARICQKAGPILQAFASLDVRSWPFFKVPRLYRIVWNNYSRLG